MNFVYRIGNQRGEIDSVGVDPLSNFPILLLSCFSELHRIGNTLAGTMFYDRWGKFVVPEKFALAARVRTAKSSPSCPDLNVISACYENDQNTSER